jgi:hypothetical protein
MSFRFITTVTGRTWPDMPNICFSYSMTLSASSQSSDAVLLAMLRKSRASPRRSAARPRRHLESCLRDKEDTLLSSLHRSSERDQELLRHRALLWMAEESAKVKTYEFEEFQTVKDLEI